VMEAENYSEIVAIGTIGSGTESYWHDTATVPADFSGAGFMKAENPGSNPGDIEVAKTSAGYLRYNINFTAGGTYYIWARASHVGGGDDSYHAALAQGDEIKSQIAFLTFQGELVPTDNAGTWVWIYMSNATGTPTPATIAVPAPGVYNYRVYIREREFKIDKIILTKNVGFIPDGKGPDETLATGLESLVAVNSVLLQVYPNPITSIATISYALNKPEYVSLKVYNVLGEEVSTIPDEMQNAGKHEIKWDATDVSGKQLNGGLYFIKIKAGSETRTVKTMLAR
ncbi:MAG TPA: T9SS type A sorting domain-containing protein, partial [Bacteroidales bacterium]|nr:T9SS type A sorting domain-containing protein [Bacteroidales bacterium]